jgi:hypothetical protein
MIMLAINEELAAHFKTQPQANREGPVQRIRILSNSPHFLICEVFLSGDNLAITDANNQVIINLTDPKSIEKLVERVRYCVDKWNKCWQAYEAQQAFTLVR